jgi:uncharacterized protein (TIGR02996 family)
MTHPDWPAFLAAIIAEPDEDTPRLVAADFLEENGDPERAAFIRAQVGLAVLEASGLGKSLEADELRKKERAFLGRFSVYPHLWAMTDCPELVSVVSPRTSSRLGVQVEGIERLGWRRGFVESVRCPAAEWLRHGGAVRARNPVQWASLTHCETVSRDAWYAGLAALRGLHDVWVWPTTANPDWDPMGLVVWLRGWLPQTNVDVPPL